MNWVNILHLYQPPTQTKEIVDLVARESYQKIIDLLDQYPSLRLTVNVAGSLLVLLDSYGHQAVIAGLRRHAERGAIELMGSAMYHPILPLLPPTEITRQIELHNRTSREYFGSAYAPSGFYFPEMAYSGLSAKTVASMGFSWTVLDEIHTTEEIDPSVRYTIRGLPLGVLFRSSTFSKSFPPEKIVREYGQIRSAALVTCHDGELYGHWHKEDHGFYQKAFTDPRMTTLTASEYLKTLTEKREVAVRDASWESTPDELGQNIPLGLWNEPKNEIHQLLERFKHNVLACVEEHQSDPGYEKARHHADRGVASCAWWWASERKLGPFSPHTWNPTEVEKGATELFTAIDALQSIAPEKKAGLVADFTSLKAKIWDKHRKKYDPSYP